MPRFLCFIPLILLPVCVHAQTALKQGMEIRSSVTINPGTYAFNGAPGTDAPVIVIEGKDITVDFNHSTLRGSNDRSRPDEFYGLAILIRKGSSGITIRNLELHGYKIGVMADSVEGLTIDHCDLSYNYRQHLNSTPLREDVSDWMSYHHNENHEWLRYGAAIYLSNCRRATITNNTVTGGQCALMMNSCTGADVADNDFSFNSGIGIGLDRSSNNKIHHNRLDFNVRGFSDGHYKRGQDSAGLLVFEQSSNNVFAFNTATHCGDGFFLWAGQTTMDTGTGGCNDNLVYGNDFSYAPANGIEATFSRNLLMKNIMKECENGVWAGYSYDTDITDNVFENNTTGIAIEHGRNMNIVLNGFTDCGTGIRLWSREKQPADWIYPKTTNTASRNYWIAANRFLRVPVAFNISGTDTVVLSGNLKQEVDRNIELGERITAVDTSRDDDFLDMDYQKDDQLKAIPDSAAPATVVPEGRKEIRMTEWGPYDFRYPAIFLKYIDTAGLYHFEIMGKEGSWAMERTAGVVKAQGDQRSFPGELVVQFDSAAADRFVKLRYTGPAFTDMYGRRQDSGSAYMFGYRAFDPPANWTVNWYRWDAAHDPSGDYASFASLFRTEPLQRANVHSVDYTWWNKPADNIPADSFATVATTKMDLPGGDYRFAVTADDFVKVFLDGREIIDAWNSKYTEADENTHHEVQVAVTKGQHELRIVQAEKTGLATLQFYIRPAGPLSW